MKKNLLVAALISLSAIGGVVAMSNNGAVAVELVQAVDITNMTKAEALQVTANDIVVGEAGAPVTVIEYASFTCGHCANFHIKHYDDIKKTYIDTGKVKFVFRELPWDNLALAIAKVARCSGPENASAFVSVFMNNYETWMKSSNQLAAIKQISRLGGVTPEAFNACVADEKLQTIVENIKVVGTDVLGITGTPTFFVNGEMVKGFMTFKELAEIIEDKLKVSLL